MQIEANLESVQALRDFAEAMPYAVNQIIDETQHLQEKYRGLESDLGVRGRDFEDIVRMCMRAAQDASDALSDLPKGLNATADSLEGWINKQLGMDGVNSGGESSAPRRGQKVKDTKTVIRR